MSRHKIEWSNSWGIGKGIYGERHHPSAEDRWWEFDAIFADGFVRASGYFPPGFRSSGGHISAAYFVVCAGARCHSVRIQPCPTLAGAKGMARRFLTEARQEGLTP